MTKWTNIPKIRIDNGREGNRRIIRRIVAKITFRINTQLRTILVYDHVGISSKWMDHIDWLGEHIPLIKAFKVERFAWDIAEVGY